MDSEEAILVYVQAIPEKISSQTKNFGELENLEVFKLSHSSKVALARAKEAKGKRKIIAIGHASVLSEALVRGADDIIAVPLCDDPLSQSESMKAQNASPDMAAAFIVGENLDGPFSGAALCGALSAICNLRFKIYAKGDFIAEAGSVILVRDDGSGAYNLDIRRIAGAMSKDIPNGDIKGTCSLEKIPPRNETHVVRDKPVKEIASDISRKLKRFSI